MVSTDWSAPGQGSLVSALVLGSAVALILQFCYFSWTGLRTDKMAPVFTRALVASPFMMTSTASTLSKENAPHSPRSSPVFAAAAAAFLSLNARSVFTDLTFRLTFSRWPGFLCRSFLADPIW